MGGTIQFSKFFNLDDAVNHWHRLYNIYHFQFGLTLSYAEIKYDGDSLCYTLSMRFSK